MTFPARLAWLQVSQRLFNFLCDTVARSKASSGWTPIHLACYFGHRGVVEELLKVRADYVHICSVYYYVQHIYICCQRNLLYAPYLQAGADVNLQNNMGDTALHQAAYTGRKVKEGKIELPPCQLICSNKSAMLSAL